MKQFIAIFTLLAFLVIASCKKQEIAKNSVAVPIQNDTTKTDTLITYPIQYPLPGTLTSETDCPYPVHDSSSQMNGRIEFITPDSVVLFDMFPYNWDSITTMKLDGNHHFHFDHGHRQADFIINGDSVQYWLHITHCNLDGDCGVWYADIRFNGKINR